MEGVRDNKGIFFFKINTANEKQSSRKLFVGTPCHGRSYVAVFLM